VLVETNDKPTVERWFPVAVSPTIVDPAFEGLFDSIT